MVRHIGNGYTSLFCSELLKIYDMGMKYTKDFVPLLRTSTFLLGGTVSHGKTWIGLKVPKLNCATQGDFMNHGL